MFQVSQSYKEEFLSQNKTGLVMVICNPSTWKAEAGGLLQGQVHSRLQEPCLKKTRVEPKEKLCFKRKQSLFVMHTYIHKTGSAKKHLQILKPLSKMVVHPQSCVITKESSLVENDDRHLPL